jgi:hypothetical protein
MSLPPASDETGRVDIVLADAKTILSILDGLTEGVIPCAPVKAIVKVAKEIVDMVQVSHSSSFVQRQVNIMCVSEGSQK